jgi:hypothetical protein
MAVIVSAIGRKRQSKAASKGGTTRASRPLEPLPDNPGTIKQSRFGNRSLKELVSDEQDYSRFLTAINLGGSIATAARSVGVNPQVVARAMQNGGGKLQRTVREDICRALAQPTLLAESSIRERNPVLWLQRVGKHLAENTWDDNPVPTDTGPVEVVAGGPQLEDFAQTLIELAKAGMITINTKLKTIEGAQPVLGDITTTQPVVVEQAP